MWERFESEKKAQERNAGVEALGPGKEEILGFFSNRKTLFQDVHGCSIYVCVCHDVCAYLSLICLLLGWKDDLHSMERLNGGEKTWWVFDFSSCPISISFPT